MRVLTLVTAVVAMEVVVVVDRMTAIEKMLPSFVIVLNLSFISIRALDDGRMDNKGILITTNA